MGLKIIRAEEKREKAAELFDLIEDRKKIAKREEALKSYFKEFMSSEEINTMKVGQFFLTTTERSTTSIDRNKLALELKDRIVEFEKITSFKVFDIKKVG